MANTETLAFEIGTEEIPAFDLKNATQQLEALVPQALDAAGVPHGTVEIFTTPRRLIAIVADVATETEALTEVFRGPSAKIAFDDQGNFTKAATGFARGKGVTVEALELRDENGEQYVFATKNTPSKPVAELLPAVLEGVIAKLAWPKSCRWGTTSAQFSRPVRWIVALLGTQVVPVSFAGLEAGNATFGHRVLAPGAHEVPSADQLIDVVKAAYVVPSQQLREAAIREGVAKIEAETGCTAQLPAKTLTEVINLSEYPTVLMGTFDEEFLQVPEEIIVDAMLMHQRYFPLYDEQGKLTNRFIIVSNGDPAASANIIEGNQRVVAARLYDAKFFYDEDRKQSLDKYVPRLSEVVFQETLGTMLEKTTRVVKMTARLVADGDLYVDQARDIARAAYLSKADLVTNAVIEFTSVQGVMGSYYALASGENERVARAIAEHYKPRFAGDSIPADEVGQAVALADKLDTICGLFAIGQAPTGSSDPFALRRAAIGVLSILFAGFPVSLVKAVEGSLEIYFRGGLQFDSGAVRDEIIAFFIGRLKAILKDEGASPEAIEAVLSTGVEEPVEIAKRVRALEEARKNQPELFEDLAVAFSRANNLRDASLGTSFKRDLLTPVEADLAAAVTSAQSTVGKAMREGDFAEALTQLATLRAPIDAFFEEVMVMDEDPAIRENRLKLLNRMVGVFSTVADFSLLA
ncbi:glycine--tRNA ligase subunit beta [Parvibacter caecicola]|uniref:Glycine--tRNA ligase beta subunit n=1 Tax=Parvibacter caecicola TaxID=747645 RepID=A0A3N0ADV9_9ACTN|nr:glycine--tRNA ligase subunit beta [Parvibacter caecicola]MBB3170437.1 glycyl-tRNA synthetase beta chain [Parvibacter caecicola]MCR2041599.1 glycine--tRNA ligase subunit beta [Parvibacter caecicola]RNL12166.1 glycine--tRNA ligase subunit beta [Parvibacter caecicola]TJW12334.1 glycine--tRNA ligase subunit beta [Parvibacter caecicola]